MICNFVGIMDIEAIRNLCNALPFVTEDIKWENDLFLWWVKKCFVLPRLIIR